MFGTYQTTTFSTRFLTSCLLTIWPCLHGLALEQGPGHGLRSCTTGLPLHVAAPHPVELGAHPHLATLVPPGQACTHLKPVLWFLGLAVFFIQDLGTRESLVNVKCSVTSAVHCLLRAPPGPARPRATADSVCRKCRLGPSWYIWAHSIFFLLHSNLKSL